MYIAYGKWPSLVNVMIHMYYTPDTMDQMGTSV